MPFEDSKDRPFGVAGQPIESDLYADTAEVDPAQNPNDFVTHPDIGYQYPGVRNNVVEIDQNILGQPGKFSARRLGYKLKG